MALFEDEERRSWTLRATVTAVDRIKSETGVDLLTMLTDRDVITNLMASPRQFVEVVHAWLLPQLTHEQISPEQFGELMYGPTMDAAFEAVAEELPQFFPPHHRPAVAATIKTFLDAEAAGVAEAVAFVTGPETARATQSLIAKQRKRSADALSQITGGGDSTDSPANSASTPVR